jgi:hypothetical protein
MEPPTTSAQGARVGRRHGFWNCPKEAFRRGIEGFLVAFRKDFLRVIVVQTPCSAVAPPCIMHDPDVGDAGHSKEWRVERAGMRLKAYRASRVGRALSLAGPHPQAGEGSGAMPRDN